MATTETKNATTIPINKIATSIFVKANPNFANLSTLAPNITGMDKKKEYSAATGREVPNKTAPSIVAPEREVPGMRESTWKIPI